MYPIFALYSDHLMSFCEPDMLLFCEEYLQKIVKLEIYEG
jgi:hypothetical protein